MTASGGFARHQPLHQVIVNRFFLGFNRVSVLGTVGSAPEGGPRSQLFWGGSEWNGRTLGGSSLLLTAFDNPGAVERRMLKDAFE